MLENYKYEKLTPMLKHYIDIKQDFKDAILLYRVGDFYETFFEDAIITSKALQLALTGKECGHDKKAPMCGVPHHVIDNYINKLVKKGHKVALCDQVEDPKYAKGLVKRAVTRIITPGTITDSDSIDKTKNNFLLSIFVNHSEITASYCDVTTGKIVCFVLRGDNNYIGKLMIDQIGKIDPSEILINSDYDNHLLKDFFQSENNLFINYLTVNKIKKELTGKIIEEHLGEKSLDLVSFDNFLMISISNLLDYIYNYQNENLSHINNIEIIDVNDFLQLDINTRKNLELHKNLNTNTRKDSLIDIIDNTDTAMGSRLLNYWLERPLIDKNKINFRLDTVGFLHDNFKVSKKITDFLDDIYDLERIVGRISYKRCNARDFISLKNSIRNIPCLKEFLLSLDNKNLNYFGDALLDLKEIFNLIDKSINPDAPISITEGDIIKTGYDDDLDKLKDNSKNAKTKLIEYEEDEKNRSGIKNLKIKFNKNNGYSIEVTKSNIDKVPGDYIRKQTLKNQERYTTEKLEELSSLILGGKESINDLEYRLFNKIRDVILNNVKKIQHVANMIANLDALNSLAKISVKNNYCKPIITNDNVVEIKDGRHPIIEKNLRENEFIANDTNIGSNNNLIQIITGPNMAGKSTYMRQTAIIIILAQIGSFVPAKSATISICDKVFTRIGASDNISKGDSTFMLEMKEVSNILKNATKNSFVVLDEVGRGTGTDDGLSIAMSLVDYLSKYTKVKTVFATHFHELTILADRYENVVNLKINIEEKNGKLIFLRKISKGKSNRSYGIEVAKMAGLPSILILNATSILNKLNNTDDEIFDKNDDKYDNIDNECIIKLKERAKNIDLYELTPLESMNILNDLIERIDNL
ncbi:MAG: DNA mismatch repair protein MutS [Tissierellia bacterium]|nr:DNA mismatch repair protein MutS [Tissierellia bacterium]